MEERGVPKHEKDQMNNILVSISQTDVINEFNMGMEKRHLTMIYLNTLVKDDRLTLHVKH